ncbi:MAG: HD domain-containing phosphohydrolase, partial [Actinomycetota bacterium]
MSERSQRWDGRPWAARSVRFLVFVVPILCSWAAGAAVDAVMPSFGPSFWDTVLRWLVVLVVATAVLFASERLAKRALPLAGLFRMTLAFPDNAPSRYKVARRTAGIRNLEERVREARERGLDDDPSRAAEEIMVLISALSNHDKRTRGHSERTHLFTSMLADELKLSRDDRDRLTWAAMVHDIGKLEVRTETLNKPGKPDEAEWEELRSHPAHGARICEPLRPWLGEWYDAIGHHHERW